MKFATTVGCIAPGMSHIAQVELEIVVSRSMCASTIEVAGPADRFRNRDEWMSAKDLFCRKIPFSSCQWLYSLTISAELYCPLISKDSWHGSQ